MHQILKLLDGGDRRSIGRANEVVACVLKDPALIDVLFSGLLLDNPLIRMRSADVLEKVTLIHPEYLLPYRELLLGTLAGIEQPEVRWHVAPMLVRIPLSEREQMAVVEILMSYMHAPSSIVKTFAMQALLDLGVQYEPLRELVLDAIREQLLDATPAMKSRGRKLLKRAESTGPATRR